MPKAKHAHRSASMGGERLLLPGLPWLAIIVVFTLAITTCLFACTRTSDQPPGPPEKVTIAYSSTLDVALAAIAQARGFYRAEGLEETPHLHPYGKPALEEVLAGKADFAAVAETPLMFAIMRGEKISVIATIQIAYKHDAIAGRKDRGIVNPADLRGKKIGITSETTSDFFASVFLSAHGISRGEVTLVALKQEELPDALIRGDLDAASLFQPYLGLAKKELDEQMTTFYEKGLYMMTFNIVARQEFIRSHPETVKKMLRALLRAEEFANQYPGEAQKIASDFSRIDVATVHEIWPDHIFAATLNQSLVLALEDESEWAIKNKLTEKTEIPNYLNYIYFDGLMAVKPEAVKILR